MKYLALAILAFGAALVPAAADASITFNVTGAFTQNNVADGSLTGTFTTDDQIRTVTGVNLVSSASGAFQQTVYDNVGQIDNQGLPNTFRITFTTGRNTNQLQLAFARPGLTATGGSIVANSFEHQDYTGSGNRLLTGTVTAGSTAAVPEPASWAMLILGIGTMGAALRRRRTLIGAPA